MMKKKKITSTLAAVVILAGCASEVDDGEEEESFEAQSEELKNDMLGVDTNNTTLDIAFARSRNVKFVARYVSFDGDPAHPALTNEEATRFRQAKMPLVSIWETGQQRAIETGSLHGQFALGAEDARKAHQKMVELGVPNKPVYFTVDFNVSAQDWTQKTKDKMTNKPIEKGDLIVAYFNGVNSVMGAKRTGAYGTYTTVKNLFDQKKIAYGWQQTFGAKGNKIDPRAQLRQYDIYPKQDGWGVGGAGALDLDRAVKGEFGQWN